MRPSESVLKKLLNYQAWVQANLSAPPTLLDYVGFTADPDALFSFAELFCPELVVHEGFHFLASGLAPGTIEGWIAKGLDMRAIQRVVNHIHISSLLQGRQIGDDVAVEAARVIAHIWSRTLAPEGLVAEAFGTDYGEAGVTFYRRPD